MSRATSNDASATATGLRIRGLSKRFDHTVVLDNIDLDVTPGDLVTVLGPSGSGKTTLLRLVCGFEHVDTGSIELGDRWVARDNKLHMPAERRGIGYVAQEGALFPHLSVQENVLFGLPRSIRKGSAYTKATRVAALLELVGLPAHYARRHPSALSGGEQQRVALARALAPKPGVVLLDEPFSALDASLRAETRQAVAASLKQVGTTALLVTHDQDEALSMGDKVAVLQRGQLAQVASPQVLYRCPANQGIARFIGEAVLVAGTLAGDAVDCCFGRLPLMPEAQLANGHAHHNVEVLIRPEQFRLGASTFNADRTDGNTETQTARVEQLDFYGHDARITLRLDDGQRFAATIPGFDLPTVGETIRFQVVGNVYAYPVISDQAA